MNLSLSTRAKEAIKTALAMVLVYFIALKDKGLHRTLVILAAAACTMAIVIWTVYTFKNSPHSLSIFVFFLVISFIAEWLLQRFKGRKIRPGAETPGPESVSG